MDHVPASPGVISRRSYAAATVVSSLPTVFAGFARCRPERPSWHSLSLPTEESNGDEAHNDCVDSHH